MYSRQCIPVSWTKAKAIPVKLFMISTGFPDRNTLTLSISLYIYIDFQWRRKRKKERERIGIEQFGNARHDRGGVPMRVSRLFSNDSIPTRFLPPKSGKLSMGGYRADRKRGRIEEGLETDWPPSSRPLESSFPFDSTFFFLWWNATLDIWNTTCPDPFHFLRVYTRRAALSSAIYLT